MSIATNTNTTNTATNSLAELNAKLIEASEDGNAEEVRQLLKLGADANAWATMALGSAGLNGHAEVVRILLAAGADATTMDDLAITDVVENGYDDVMRVLTEWKEANK